jgi:hypothetical protein
VEVVTMTEVQPTAYDRTDGTTWVDQIPWGQFEPEKVDPEQLKTVKAAALVEFNAHDYATYLTQVFPDDEDFKQAAWQWAQEEVLHGIALGRWAKLADPTFDFEAAIRRFREGFSLPLDATESVRGSRAGELVARCIVEVGTSSFYTAFGQAMPEPVFRKICQRIAADEFRHYKLFYTHLKRYLERDRIGKLRRLRIALGRIAESEDDELAYAYYAGNSDGSVPYDRKIWSSAYMRRAYQLYRREHVERATAMTLKAAGLDPKGRLASLGTDLAYWYLRRRRDRLARGTEPPLVSSAA